MEAVSVCIGYADFLRETAPLNRPHFSRWYVVTTTDDRDTQSVCKQFGIDCITSDDHKRGGSFNKGRLLNRALAFTTGTDWILHVDADVALPADTNVLLEEAHLDTSCIYGCDRFNVVGYEKWLSVRHALTARGNPWMIRMDRGLSVGARVANIGHGYTPIGFFQLWHGSERVTYPLVHGTAARTDVQHALHWDRRKRVHLPELVVWHLESEAGHMGINWSGRKSQPFDKAYR